MLITAEIIISLAFAGSGYKSLQKDDSLLALVR
jgi:hypothetical protein